MGRNYAHSSEHRNYLLAIVNGMMTRLGMSLTHPSTVLAVFVRILGGSNALVGLLPAIRFGGWFLPQFLAASWIQPRPRKVPITVALEIVRVVIYGLLGALAWGWGASRPALVLILFFALFIPSRLTAGSGALARMDVIGKVVPPSRRVSFFAVRNFWGGVVAFGAGLLIRSLLDEQYGLPFPVNFALLFGLSCVSFVVATLSFSWIEEMPDSEERPQHSLGAQLARAPRLLTQDPAFGRYLLARALLTAVRISDPFYAVFALDVLGAPASMVGFYLAAMTLSELLSNLLWQRMARASGTYAVARLSSLLTALGPLLAVALPWLMRLAGLTVERYGLLPAYVFTGVFLLVGASNSGRMIGLMTLLLDIAPEAERASYIGLVNTVLGVVSLLPIVSGALIDRIGFEPIFWVATGLLLLGYVVTLRIRPATG